MKLNLKEGEALVKLARKAVESYFTGEEVELPKNSIEDKLQQKRGVFVTLETYPTKELRGCLGLPQPDLPLSEGIIKAAKDSATADPRFPPLGEEELKNIVIEVTVLTITKIIEVKDKKDYPKKIELGKDGLIIRQGMYTGLLLPQVAAELNLDAEAFLEETCIKAGLPQTAWLEPETEVLKFQGQIFTEQEPKGKIIEKVL